MAIKIIDPRLDVKIQERRRRERIINTVIARFKRCGAMDMELREFHGLDLAMEGIRMRNENVSNIEHLLQPSIDNVERVCYIIENSIVHIVKSFGSWYSALSALSSLDKEIHKHLLMHIHGILNKDPIP
ncbi:unnamed protein product [Dovyalis caffra]|uniref:Uncharacterized protein n=1 Tax=Dovyalis caffra TaxID=77055 RepID=A0AAV1RRY4_9ROSI|nr:unnamed protein product [Dovyalis caffra]